MFKVEFDSKKNLLRILQDGHVREEDARAGLREIEAIAPTLQPGFSLLSDMTDLEEMDLGCAAYIRKVMDVLEKHGINLVVRVIPDPKKDIGLNIMSLFHYHRGLRIVTVASMEQATNALESRS
ncbi:MAG TPA: hypothetical protein VLT36_22450 [Candidatus Dormibacteraeota bacterium]|nr:hypothetical protein [Candidatus Dormibacteraeota bacterium]